VPIIQYWTGSSQMTFQIKRAYEPAERSDGMRILVDRLWPRGVKKATLKLDRWIKEVAPTPQLRQWFGHKPARFAEFSRRYRAELAANTAVAELRKLGERKTVTLIYAARDPTVNHALVLESVLQRRPVRGMHHDIKKRETP
jgi:uncharacterized protein YeaO (DUF488 family)